jgi:transcriptional regulator with PAS, ATPase and Fis domain
VPAKRHPIAVLSSGYEKLIGDEECGLIVQALEESRYNQTAAASLLGISRESLAQKLRDDKNSIRREAFRHCRRPAE